MAAAYGSLHLTSLVLEDTFALPAYPVTLRSLEVSRPRWGDNCWKTDMDAIGMLTQLTHLRLSGRQGFLDYPCLDYPGGEYVPPPDMAPLSSLLALESFVYSDGVRLSLAEVRMLASLPKLTSLDL